MNSLILDKWSLNSGANSTSVILPDGCCDVIVSKPKNQAAEVKLSALMHTPQTVHSPNQTSICGYRLQPGTQVDLSALTDLIRHIDPDEDCSAEILSVSHRNPAIQDALSCLESEMLSIDATAKRLGVRTRTLQRLFAEHAVPSPVFWLQLARVRRAGRDIVLGKTLGDIAYAVGFSDQAHMSRAIRSLFGITPTQLKHRADLTWQLFQPAFATGATGEQISTKLPSISLT